jgi:hypothetical protein
VLPDHLPDRHPERRPFRHPIRWLRTREWFWPSAFWHGCRWCGRLFTHPFTATVAGLFTLATILGLVFVVRVDGFTGLLIVVIAFLIVIARGARLKWRADRADRPAITPESGSRVVVQPGAIYNEIHHHHGADALPGAPRFWLPRGVEVTSTDVEIREDPRRPPQTPAGE